MKDNIILSLGAGSQLTPKKGAGPISGEGGEAEFHTKFENLLQEQSALNDKEDGKDLPNSEQDLAGPGQQQTERMVNKMGRPIIVSGKPPTEAQVTAFANLQGIEPKGLEGLVKKELVKQAKTNPSLGVKENIRLQIGTEKARETSLGVKENIRSQIDSEKTTAESAGKSIFDQRNTSSSERELLLGVAQKDVFRTNQHLELSPLTKDTLNVAGAEDIPEGMVKRSIKENNVESLIGLRNSGGEDFVSADKKFSIPLSPAKLSLLSKSPIVSKSKDFNNRDESVRQNVSVHISKEGAERNLEGGSFFEVSKKVQIEEFLNRMIEIRNQNKTLSPAVTQMPAIDLTDTLQELNIEGVGVNSVLERGRRLERQIDDGSNRTLVRDLSVSGEVGALKSGRPPERESALMDIQKNVADMEPLAKKMSEMLGQRLIAQITKGAWRVEMELYPRALGRVEIQLEMVNGHLEANFQTNQALTKEILNEGISRLKDSLQEFGMESASVSVELGKRNGSDKKATVPGVDEDSDAIEIVKEDSQTKGKLDDISIDGRLDFFV